MRHLIIVLIIGLLFFSSCYDFLKEEPKTEIAVDQYFDTPEEARSVVNAIYREGAANRFGGSAYSGLDAMMGGYMSGLFNNEYKGQEVHVQHMHNLSLDPVNMASYFGGQWEGAYEAISRANNALKYVPEVENLDSSEENRLLAEARFFRAFNYFFLVKTWGDVPLITEPYESLDNIYVERDDISVVYDQIIDDLTWAINQGNLADATYPENNFRITRGAAQSLLADTYLQRAGYPSPDESYYEDAASVATDIINSGTYELIEHGEDLDESAYNVLRTSDEESEYIYAIEFEAGIAENGWLASYSYPVVTATEGYTTFSITNNAYEPVEELIRIYDPDEDLRIQEQQFFHTQREMPNGDLHEFDRAPYLYHDTEALFETNQGDRNLDIYRYAEILLIAAESIARNEGVTAEAVGYLADVRDRAYWETDRSDIENELSGLSVDAFVEEVWTERLREFVLEWKIWDDVQRTRQFPTTSEGNPGEVEYVDVIGHTNEWGSTFTENDLLFPISENEMQTNPELDQNPGY